jgi:valyl-tRNA synthetase
MLKVEIDKAAESARLSKEAEKLQKALDKLEAKLANPATPTKPRRIWWKKTAPNWPICKTKWPKCKASC